MKEWVKKTQRPEVLGGLGGFAGLFDASALKRYERPLLASATDGVGTKVDLARKMGVYDTIGHDLVGMVVDDLVVCGAEPLFMTDYICVGKVHPERVAAIVKGIAEGCVLAGCALVGGETAEHPGLLGPDDFDVAGAGTGVVETDQLLGADRIREGDAVIAMASSGLHSNGYSLVRHVVFDRAGMDPGPAGRGVRPHARRGAAGAHQDLLAGLPGADPHHRGARFQPHHRRRSCQQPGPGHPGPPARHGGPLDLDAGRGLRPRRHGGQRRAARTGEDAQHGRRHDGDRPRRTRSTWRSRPSRTGAWTPGSPARSPTGATTATAPS